MTFKIPLTPVIICGLFLAAPAGFSQGALTPPPGAPGPTMKTLAQIEPRTPVATNTTPGDANDVYIISQPGSYYLTSNLVGVGTENGIEIAANDVTLDLNGFTLQSVPTNASFLLNNGITMQSTLTNVTVRNGMVTGWLYGLFSLSQTSANMVVEHVNFANCNAGSSAAAAGIYLSGGVIARDCTFENDTDGIECNGYNSPVPSIITDCTDDNSQIGFSCGGTTVITGCTVVNCQNSGILIGGGQGSVVSGCTANNDSAAIYVYAPQCRIEANHITTTNSGYGILIGGNGDTNNIVIKNSVEGYGVNNYHLISGQVVGPIITAAGTITNSNPWANFSF